MYLFSFFVSATTVTSTSRPSPPWLITSQPPMWSTIKPSSVRPPHLMPPSKPVITPPEPVPVPATTTVRTSSTTNHFVPKVLTEPVPPQRVDSADEPPDEITTLPFTTVTPRNGDPVKVTTCKFNMISLIIVMNIVLFEYIMYLKISNFNIFFFQFNIKFLFSIHLLKEMKSLDCFDFGSFIFSAFVL